MNSSDTPPMTAATLCMRIDSIYQKYGKFPEKVRVRFCDAQEITGTEHLREKGGYFYNGIRIVWDKSQEPLWSDV